MLDVTPGSTKWLKKSIMATRGEGRRRKPATHHITEKVQGSYHYTMGPYSEPVMQIKPGDRVVVETRDAFEGKIKKTTDKPTKVLQMPFLNPQNGPIMVEGAEPGDALAVHIESMLPRGEQPRGTCCLIPEFGALTGTYYTATLNQPLPEVVRKLLVDEETVHWNDRIKLPYKPHIGTLSCSPQIDSISSLTPDNHGGNMDLPDMGPGTVTYLPVRVPGARLFIGDAHACQGDGEVDQTAIETSLRGRLQLTVRKGMTLAWPRAETATDYISMGTDEDLTKATRIAVQEMIDFLVASKGLDRHTAYQLTSIAGHVAITQLVDGKMGVHVRMPKAIFTSR